MGFTFKFKMGFILIGTCNFNKNRQENHIKINENKVCTNVILIKNIYKEWSVKHIFIDFMGIFEGHYHMID